MKVSVVIPTYNESHNVRQMAEALWALPLAVDILVVDDGSGNLEVLDTRGDITVDDGSGEIVIRNVTGSVKISDGAGNITVEDVGKDFIVKEDGSGSIKSVRVKGKVVEP